MNSLVKVAIATTALSLPLGAFASETLTIKVDGVEVLSHPKVGSKSLTQLPAGAQVEGLAKRGLFWKVKTPQGQSGFIMVTKVTIGNPGMSANLSGAMRSILKSRKDESASTGRVRTQDAVMGIRGLSSDDLSSVGALRPNLDALSRLEDFSVPPQEIDALQSAVLTESDSLNR